MENNKQMDRYEAGKDLADSNTPIMEQNAVYTNGKGAIIEGNETVAKLINVENSDSMKGKLLVSFVHRKYVKEFHEFLRKVIEENSGVSKRFWLRPRGGMPFQAFIQAHVVAKKKAMILICWNIKNLFVEETKDSEKDVCV